MKAPESESAKDLLRSEFTRRVREAVTLRDWANLEHWAQQWILFEPTHPTGFKWLARASVALTKMKRAAYAYGRLLDFEPQNEEARKFFADYPSILSEQPSSVQKAVETPSRKTPSIDPETLISPDQRRLLANAELELGAHYEKFLLFIEAAERYKKSFSWHPSQAAALGAGRALHRSQRGLDAIRFLREQVNKFPNWIDGRLLLARVHYEIGQRLEAQSEWQNILKFDPHNKEALSFLRNLTLSSVP